MINKKFNVCYINIYNRLLLMYTKHNYKHSHSLPYTGNCTCSNCRKYKLSKKKGLVKNKFTRFILQKNFKSKNFINALNIFKAIKKRNSWTAMFFSLCVRRTYWGNSSQLWKTYFRNNIVDRHLSKLEKLNKIANKWDYFIEKYHPFLIMFTFSNLLFKISNNANDDKFNIFYDIKIENFNTWHPKIHMYFCDIKYFKGIIILLLRCFKNKKSLTIKVNKKVEYVFKENELNNVIQMYNTSIKNSYVD